MAFGPSKQTSAAMTGLQDNAGTTSAAGGNLLNLGGENTTAGTNFFRTLLNGNRADTTAVLQPNIDQIRQGQQQTMQAVNTLAPRGGARSSTLFSLPFQANSQIQSLFNPMRSAAATQLTNTGLQQSNLGNNLFSTSNTGNSNLGNLGIQQQKLSNDLMSGLGGGLFNLFTTPMSAFSGGLLGAI